MRQPQVVWAMMLLAVAEVVVPLPSPIAQERASEFYFIHNPTASGHQVSSELQRAFNSRAFQDFNDVFFNSRNHFPNRNPARSTVSSNPHVPSGIESLSTGAVGWNIEKIPVVQNPASLLPAVSYKENFNFQQHLHSTPGSSSRFGGEIPRIKQRLSQPEGNIPAAIAPLPQPESNIPAAIAPLPQTEGNIPAAIAPLPQPEDNIPAAIAPLPQTEGNIPAAIAPLPQPEDNIPAAIAPLPQPESNIPAAIAPLPQPESNIPAAITPLPQPGDNIPAAIAPLPQPESHIPAAIAPLPQPESNIPAAIAPLLQPNVNVLADNQPLPHSEGNVLPTIAPLLQSENNIPAISGSSNDVERPVNVPNSSSEIFLNSSSSNSQNGDSQNKNSGDDSDDSVEITDGMVQTQATSGDDQVVNPSIQNNGFLVKQVTNHIALEPSSPEDASEQLAISLNNILPSNNYLYTSDDTPFYLHHFTDETKYPTEDDSESSPSEDTATVNEEENNVTSVDNLLEAGFDESESSKKKTSLSSLPSVAEDSSKVSNNAESTRQSEPDYQDAIKKLENDENVLNAKYKFLAAWNSEVARQGVYMLRIANVYPETGFVYMPDIEYYTRSLQVSPVVQAATADLMSAWQTAKQKHSLDGIALNVTSSSTDQDSGKPSQVNVMSNETDSAPPSSSTSQIGSLRFEFPQVPGNHKYPYQPYILPNNRVYLHQPYLSYINSVFPYLSYLQRGNVVHPSQLFIQAPNPNYLQGITRPADVENAIPVGNNEIPGRVPDQWDVKDLTRPNAEPEVSPPVAAHHRPASMQTEAI
ncbi:hypothetical protein FHG87_005454 [Trinorchestia longiramus]|nr:hypothetical protein FHG87_005454 [Trinorchestia longiramus]